MNTTKTATDKPIIDIATSDLNTVIPLMFLNPIISDFIENNNPINEQVISNECYHIEYDDYDNTTKIMVYLNPDYVANIRKRG